MNRLTYNRGFTALTAAVIASVLLAIGMAILNITYKEIRLSSFSRSSTEAFYTAGGGIECALYWDSQGAFATSSASDPNLTVECFESTATPIVSSGANSATTQFSIQNTTTDTCLTVQVEKNTNSTTIESRGYNTCNAGSNRRLERGLRVTY